VDRLKKIQELASKALEKTQKTMKKKYDQHKSPAKEYQPGDYVWLEMKNLSTTRPNKKLEDKRIGPYKIIEKVGAGAYRLDIPASEKRKIHPVINEVLLSPYIGRTKNPEKIYTPEFVDVLEEKAEQIVDSRFHRGGLQYLVKWSNKPRSDNTWLPKHELIKENQGLIDEFHRRVPEAPNTPNVEGQRRNPERERRAPARFEPEDYRRLAPEDC
jgi:hypothetical protein